MNEFQKEFHSFGIIAITATKKNVLLVCRKDSIGFCEFVKGKYTNESDLYKLFSYMSRAELELLSGEACSFEDVYCRMWNVNIVSNSITTTKQEKKFNDNRELWYRICLEKIQQNDAYDTPEWGFPKGKKEKHENGIRCAIRELSEETGIDVSMLNFDLKNSSFASFHKKELVEIREEGNARFICHYYVALLDNEIKQLHNQKNEISMIKFVPLQECHNFIRPYFVERINILKQLNKIALCQ